MGRSVDRNLELPGEPMTKWGYPGLAPEALIGEAVYPHLRGLPGYQIGR